MWEAGQAGAQRWSWSGQGLGKNDAPRQATDLQQGSICNNHPAARLAASQSARISLHQQRRRPPPSAPHQHWLSLVVDAPAADQAAHLLHRRLPGLAQRPAVGRGVGPELHHPGAAPRAPRRRQHAAVEGAGVQGGRRRGDVVRRPRRPLPPKVLLPGVRLAPLLRLLPLPVALREGVGAPLGESLVCRLNPQPALFGCGVWVLCGQGEPGGAAARQYGGRMRATAPQNRWRHHTRCNITLSGWSSRARAR